MSEQWTNERGNRVADEFVDGDRYIFDFEVCTPKDGWEQYDTSQDAWYFGVWVNVAKRQVITFAEGDLTTVHCSTAEALGAELQSMAECYGAPPPAFTTIDAEAGLITRHYTERPGVSP